MIDYYGNWIEEDDYNTYPKEKWCDMDYMAAYLRPWMKENGYELQTTMENLIDMILSHLTTCTLNDDDNEYEDYTYYYPEDSLMVVPERAMEFVNNCGGLVEFDYEC